VPIFIYKCKCGIEFEALVLSTSQLTLVSCPRCESKEIEIVPSTFSFKFKSSPMGPYRGPASNPFENLTLQHVRDENNKPVKVNSLSELRAAEKRHGFVHAFSNSLTQESIDNPPQHEQWAGDIRHDYQWKWTPPDQRDDMEGVTVGPTTRDKLLVQERAS
jgi:hypothetical protein